MRLDCVIRTCRSHFMAIIKRPARSSVSNSVRANISNYSQNLNTENNSMGRIWRKMCVHCVSNFSKVLHKAQQSNLLQFLNTESN